VKPFKRDYLYMHEMDHGRTVTGMLALWFEDSNTNHLRKGLKMRPSGEEGAMQDKLEGCPVWGGQLQSVTAGRTSISIGKLDVESRSGM
jgi:hypothetical protein